MTAPAVARCAGCSGPLVGGIHVVRISGDWVPADAPPQCITPQPKRGAE